MEISEIRFGLFKWEMKTLLGILLEWIWNKIHQTRMEQLEGGEDEGVLHKLPRPQPVAP